MVWGAFSSRGISTLCFVTQSMDSTVYQQTLEGHLLPFMQEKHSNLCIFQQDNASCHKSRSTKAWLQERQIHVLEWPALSPDLNPIESLWGIMSKRIYSNGVQFSSVESLKIAVMQCWNEISIETCQKLVCSMPTHCEEVIKSKSIIGGWRANNQP
jgi:transposase